MADRRQINRLLGFFGLALLLAALWAPVPSAVSWVLLGMYAAVVFIWTETWSDLKKAKNWFRRHVGRSRSV
jgi:hypothetical protein